MLKKVCIFIITLSLLFTFTACNEKKASSNESVESELDINAYQTFSKSESSENTTTDATSNENGTLQNNSQSDNNHSVQNKTPEDPVSSENKNSNIGSVDEPIKEKKNMKIVFLGDSLTEAGIPEYSFVTHVTNTLRNKYSSYNFVIVNKGISGNGVADCYARLQRDVISQKPDIVSILVGVNDTATYKTNVSDTEFKNIYISMLDDIKQKLPNAKIILMTPFVFYRNDSYSIDNVVGKYNCVKELAETYSTTLIDTNALIATKRNEGTEKEYCRDGVHPNDKGAKLIAEKWIECTEKIFE